MTRVINVAEYENTSFREIRLKALMQTLSLGKQSYDFNDERSWHLKPGRLAIRYLKLTGQFRGPLEVCLKTFNGETDNTLTKERKEGRIKLYEEISIAEGNKIRSYAAEKINKKDIIILDFADIEKKIDSTNREQFDFFIWRGFDVLDNSQELIHDEKGYPLQSRINNSAPTYIDKLEGKLREIGKYACIYEAIEFVSTRINVNGEYHFRKIVQDLEELYNDFLVDRSKNEKNKIRAEKDIDELVDEAIKEYEVLNQPKYLFDKNSYRAAVRKKFERKLDGFKKKSIKK